MDQSPWKANSCSTSQETPCILCRPKVRCMAPTNVHKYMAVNLYTQCTPTCFGHLQGCKITKVRYFKSIKWNYKYQNQSLRAITIIRTCSSKIHKHKLLHFHVIRHQFDTNFSYLYDECLVIRKWQHSPEDDEDMHRNMSESRVLNKMIS
jgi:hypothetical protein